MAQNDVSKRINEKLWEKYKRKIISSGNNFDLHSEIFFKWELIPEFSIIFSCNKKLLDFLPFLTFTTPPTPRKESTIAIVNLNPKETPQLFMQNVF